MHRFFNIFLLCLLFFIAFSGQFCLGEEVETISPEAISADKQYQQAKFYYNELHTNTSLGNSRDNWLNGVRNFRKIYLAGPKSEYAAPSLYMLGRMYLKMYKRFQVAVDLQESLSYYRDVSALFPEDRLADDAHYAVGKIYLEVKNNPQKAAIAFTRIIADYRNGDMYPHAADSLKSLSKNHDIPLPDAMLQRSYLENLTNVLPVKYWSSDDYTRVAINASGPVTYQETLLEKNGDQPRRLYIDFQESYIDPRYRSPVPIEDGLLKQIRTGQFTPEVVRVVLDIESISSYKIFSLPDPFRVVIDVRGELKAAAAEPSKRVPKPPSDIMSDSLISQSDDQADETIIVLEDFKKKAVNAKAVAASTANEDPPLSTIQFSLAQQLGLGVRKIVIDPGHGGKDPGASAFGLVEKDVVLNIAQKLAPILAEETGAEVILTRSSDMFIPLEERTAIANTNDADLFISLHINAHPSPKVHGIETYYLNLTTNAEAMRVAAFENATSTHQMSDLQDILSDIMKNSKINESSRLAGYVHNSLCSGINDINGYDFKNLGVKQAPFYVLIGAEMPAILVEIAFITNPS
ncbi:MAG: N-acetylmuramoyl-L-alanine amidase, partial [Proteobacteria bacterium]|nr:N-acetylmuramoyl-L-alanine amidase [Pseudomonadota bacterium]